MTIPCYLHDDPKPQHGFRRVLADNSHSPFKHLESDHADKHPYYAEIMKLIEGCGLDELQCVTGKLDLEEMKESYIWVESESQLKELAEVLSKEKVFGVDTEQHSLRSFLGFTALIQISTQSQDYLVDTIALHDCISILRPLFADPSICKVFHGADSDVLWLQRDFHIYVVNLFDTAKACEVLSKPHNSLAYLLDTYCGVPTDKLLRLEDWRQRPLPMEMVQYAQTDTHYLLYITSRLLAELEMLDNGNSCPNDKFRFVLEAIRGSNKICLQLYSKDRGASPGESASSILSRHFSSQGGIPSVSCEIQNAVSRFCAWRDLMARVHDESLRYVISDQDIAALVKSTPTTAADMLTTISLADYIVDSSSNCGLSSPSPVVYSHLNDLHYLLHNKISNPNDLLPKILQNCLGTKGSCPLSIFNYFLLVKCNPEMTLVTRQNGVKSTKQNRGRRLLCDYPVYHNFKIYADDGQLFGYCNHKVLEWYLNDELATLVEEDPPAIMLKGRPDDRIKDIYTVSKENMCVGCGARNHYLRHRIVPRCYSKHIPEHLGAYYFVLLCVDCHGIALIALEKYKKQIADVFHIPLCASLPTTFGNATPTESRKLRSAANALLRNGSKLSSKRQEELTEIVTTYYGGRQIYQEDLEKALFVGLTYDEIISKKKRKPYAERRRLGMKKGIGESSITLNRSLDLRSNGDNTTSKHKKSSLLGHGPHGKQAVDGTPLPASEIRVNGSLVSVANGDGIDESNGDNTTSKHKKRGHGPHGKQVVDHLFKEYGEDGVVQFCQWWRQVFVEILHPRFLPADWDITHRLTENLAFSIQERKLMPLLSQWCS